MRWQVQAMGDNNVSGNTWIEFFFSGQSILSVMLYEKLYGEAEVMTDGDRRIKSNIGLLTSVTYLYLLK